MAPATNFISDYLHVCEGTESPLEWNVWGMLSALSAMAGRRFWFNLGHLTFYPNLYVAFVGPPGMTKSTAMSFPKNLIRAIGCCPVASSKITKEALTMIMSSTIDGKPKKTDFEGRKFFSYEGKQLEYNQYAIFATELVDFIGVDPQGFLDFLTTIWDEPMFEVITKNKGCDFIAGPYITCLCCITPEKLKGYLKLSVLTGGFARRTAFVFSASKKVVPIPERFPSQDEALHRCVAFGRTLQSASGPFDWTQETKDFYCDWYIKNKSTIKDKHPHTQGWLESKHEILFKLSMLICLATNGDRMIQLPHWRMAMRYCDMVERNLERVFEGTGINPNAQVAVQICSMLERMNLPMNKKVIESNFFDQAQSIGDLRDTMTHLCNVGRLEMQDVSVNGILRGTLIASRGCLARYKVDELVAFLARPAGLQTPVDTDSTEESDLSSEHHSPLVDLVGGEDRSQPKQTGSENGEVLPTEDFDSSTPKGPAPDSQS